MPRHTLLAVAVLAPAAISALLHHTTAAQVAGLLVGAALLVLALRRSPRMPAAPAEARDIVWVVVAPDRGFARAFLCADRAAEVAVDEQAVAVAIELDGEVSL